MIVVLAERQLERALAEQARRTKRFHRSIGSVGELSAYASLRAASRKVVDCDRAAREARRGVALFAFTLPADATAPSQARSEATDRLRDRIDHSVVSTVALLLSETVTNAVTHGLRSDCETVDLDGQLLADRVRLEVANAGPAFAHVAQLPAPSDPGGRGLTLVDALSCAWGHEHADGVTGVWFEVTA